MTDFGCLDIKISQRLISAGVAWHQLKARKLWCSKHLTLARKVFVDITLELSVALCSSTSHASGWNATAYHLSM